MREGRKSDRTDDSHPPAVVASSQRPLSNLAGMLKRWRPLAPSFPDLDRMRSDREPNLSSRNEAQYGGGLTDRRRSEGSPDHEPPHGVVG